MDFDDEPDIGTVVAINYGDPDQEVWTRLGTAWVSFSGPPTDWEEMHERGDVVILVPVDRDQFEAGRREGRFEVLREIHGALNRASEATYALRKLTG